ncbi:hypothetical protein NDU88_005066 [Pleurodeles waltl]|uniref:Uncharacterized protein n=1 Tax=Pleurodeles waltl TaxID=8319 RepID=A0AAV7TTQ4_PLEWA|nr:hypothetical protein NDU88_005066 [Pleurodeles waltl]
MVQSGSPCFSQSAGVLPKHAFPAAQVPECMAAAILSPRVFFRFASSPFVSEPNRRFLGVRSRTSVIRVGHHIFRSFCAESGAELIIIAPGLRRERREPQKEAATAMAPSHAPRCLQYMPCIFHL